MALALVVPASLPATASASASQIAILQAAHDPGAMAEPQQTLAQMRALGATTVRVIIPWSTIAPRPQSVRKPSFDATDPNAYPAGGWAPYDAIVQTARQDGLRVDFTVSGGAPRWAEGPGVPKYANQLYLTWKPSASAFGQFVHAVGARYSGHFTPPGSIAPLPAVLFWAIFEEPNFGEHLGPQAVDGSRVSVAPLMYRRLVNAGWQALRATGHGHDTILIGEVSARGQSAPPSHGLPQGLPGYFGQTKPLPFIRTLYCVNSNYLPLRGVAAKTVGCPTSAAGSRAFRRQNPGLFDASGVADHAANGNQPPNVDGRSDPDLATFANFDRLQTTLDRVCRAYGSGRRYAIYDTESGYTTHPPSFSMYVSPSTAAYYNNWAEYLAWKNPRVASYMAYLRDPAPLSYFGHFDNGLETSSGQPKLTYAAYRLPLYLPKTSASRSASTEIWGDARPAPFMQHDSNGPQTVSIQLNNQTIKTVNATGAGGYFDLHMRFPTSGTVRLAYTYPSADPFLPIGTAGSTVYSRTTTIKLH